MEEPYSGMCKMKMDIISEYNVEYYNTKTNYILYHVILDDGCIDILALYSHDNRCYISDIFNYDVDDRVFKLWSDDMEKWKKYTQDCVK